MDNTMKLSKGISLNDKNFVRLYVVKQLIMASVLLKFMSLLQEYGQHIIEVLPALLKGMTITLQVTLSAAIFGVVIGLITSLAKLSRKKRLNWCATIYIDCVRGTPLLVQILLIYFGIPRLISEISGNPVNIDAMIAGYYCLQH